MAKSVKFALDFKVAEEEDLYTLDIPLRFQIHTSGTIHGLAFWFDVAFIGSFTTVWVCHSKIQVLSTLKVLKLIKDDVKTEQIFRFPIETRFSLTMLRSTNFYF